MFHFSRITTAGSAAVLLLALAALPARADTTDPTDTPAPPAVTWSANATPPVGAVQDCLDGGDVWLVVVTETGDALANGCIGRPATGKDALLHTGLSIGRDASGFICALGGHPDPCPKSFEAAGGAYWQYYTGSATSPWTYATEGPDTLHPAGGTLQGWCYGTECTPPPIDLLLAGAPTTTQEPIVVSLTPTPAPSTAVVGGSPSKVFEGVAAVIALVIVIAAIAWLQVRRSRGVGRAEA